MMLRLLYDFYVFVTMLIYWPFVVLVMLPLRAVDRALGTRLVVPLIRLTKVIGNL